MSRFGKVCISTAILLMLVVFVIPNLLNLGWINLYGVLLGFSGLSLIAAIIVDRDFYFGFLSMKTTRHGLSMGAVTIMALAFLLCVNYLANRHNKTWDLTTEQLNSLSPQTLKILKGLDSEVLVKVFYQGAAVAEAKSEIKQTLRLFSETSSRFKAEFINSYENQAQAVEYLSNQTDKATSPIIGFIEYKGKRIRLGWPMGEEQITLGLIKATRQANKKIYLVNGHGERDLANESEEGIAQFVASLKEATYSIENLSLLENAVVPADANMVAVIGPSAPFMEQEMQILRDYVRQGGNLLLALDPMQRHNLANLTKSFGVEFANNVVVSVSPRLSGRGEWTVIANQYDATNPITSSLSPGSYVVMDIVSEVKPAFDKDAGLTVSEIIKSSESSYAVADPKMVNAKDIKMKSQPLGVAVTSGSSQDAKPFQLVVFGDSDFLTNKSLMLYANRDLALNTVAQLTNETDLISIRPKMPKGTMVALTQINRNIFHLGILMLPFLLMGIGVFVWLKRKNA